MYGDLFYFFFLCVCVWGGGGGEGKGGLGLVYGDLFYFVFFFFFFLFFFFWGGGGCGLRCGLNKCFFCIYLFIFFQKESVKKIKMCVWGGGDWVSEFLLQRIQIFKKKQKKKPRNVTVCNKCPRRSLIMTLIPGCDLEHSLGTLTLG